MQKSNKLIPRYQEVVRAHCSTLVEMTEAMGDLEGVLQTSVRWRTRLSGDLPYMKDLRLTPEFQAFLD